MNGLGQSSFAGVMRSTGELSMFPKLSGLVAALATDGTKLYLGGEFTSASGQLRNSGRVAV